MNSLWSVTPNESDRYISMCMSYSTADQVVPVIRQLANTYGLVCFDPQDNSIYLPPSFGRTLELTVPGKRKLINPESDILAFELHRALEGRSYAILESEPGYYVQAGSGPGVGMNGPGYAVEYRDGSADGHFRYETPILPPLAGTTLVWAHGLVFTGRLSA